MIMIRRRFKGYYHYCYITINLVNGKMYVGDHTTMFLTYDHYRGSGSLFTKAIKKYGRKNFQKRILKFYPTRLEAHLAETDYIVKYNTQCPNGYNLSPTGGIGCIGCHSEDTKQKIRKATILRKAYLNFRTPEANKKRHNTVIAFYQTPEGIKQKRINVRLMHTPEAIIKRSIATQIFYQTPEGLKVKEKKNIKISEVKKDYYQSPKGELQRSKSSKRMKLYYQTSEGIAERERMSEKGSIWHNTKSSSYNFQKRANSRKTLLLERQGRAA